MTTRLEYIWLDGYTTPNLRCKSKYIETPIRTIEECPHWSFDGSSTKQAIGSDSDCVLRPVKLYKNPLEQYHSESYLVLCEVENTDEIPHETNTRSKLRELVHEKEQHEMWFGIEQEYVFADTQSNRLSGWPKEGYPLPQGEYYCGVGAQRAVLEHIVNQHSKACLDAGLPLEGTNAEVMLSQWEYQLGTKDAIDISDDLWISRYLLYKISAEYDILPCFWPKPVKGDWNGTGAHINFSTQKMRDEWDTEDFNAFCDHLGEYHNEMIERYGEDNDTRLTGQHETAHIDDYSYGKSDRGCSIRIPYAAYSGGVGYLEDRRPAGNIDPYTAIGALVEFTTICEKKLVQVNYKI